MSNFPEKFCSPCIALIVVHFVSISVCGTNCHKKCEKFMPNLCGVNQKMLAEVLSQVRKAPSVSQRKQGTTSVRVRLIPVELPISDQIRTIK